MFERFTERSRQVVVLAQDEARLLRHNYIGTEHLLLGLLREEEGLAARVLESLQIGLDDVRARIEREVGQGEDVPAGQIPFTPKAKKVLELALREALSLKHNYIGTEHVLLGLVTVTDGVAVRILQELDADPARIRGEVLGLLEGSGGGSPPPPKLRSWEYRVETLVDRESLTGELLAPLGAEGWELVAIVGEPPGARLVFKRPARS
jgi:ATP-dependent Clp protease ATP-binding subunit ClpC